MESPLEILKKYWGYTQFRPPQDKIINSILAGKDTLALLPTGGGKSICFQVPALMKEGLTLVVSPLIALMKDQVQNLKRRDVSAAAIYSGMNLSEIELVFNHCYHGKTKLLYLSPERLKTASFKERLSDLTVSLLAIDEAHCISQWGYDFRPPYLEIANIRELLGEVPVLALTASATERVKKDIVEKLGMKNPAVFQKSFLRSNLSYVCMEEENKREKMLKILNSVKGTAIVYSRNRKGTEEIAGFLQSKKISAGFYHAGLNSAQRNQAQENWVNGKTRVIAATNAFGMGIDKPDVRVVIHLDLPDSLEAYYQEAGRAGRDEKHSYAVVLYNAKDISDLESRSKQSVPEISFLRKVYQSLANFLQVGIGSGENHSYDFDYYHFYKNFLLPPAETYSALRLLEREGFLLFNETFHEPSRLHISVAGDALYKYQVAHEEFDRFIKLILRIYGGELFSNFIHISEKEIAVSSGTTVDNVIDRLKFLSKGGLVNYYPKKDKPQISFLTGRYDADRLPLDVKKVSFLKEISDSNVRAVVSYMKEKNRCKTLQLLEYFGELSDKKCGVCDFCLDEKNKHGANDSGTLLLEKKILTLVKSSPAPAELLIEKFGAGRNSLVIEAIRNMLDRGELLLTNNNEYVFNSGYKGIGV